MSFITFIYKIDGDTNIYYGKYITDYISDDHEGLDIEVKTILIPELNNFRKNNNLSELDDESIIVGILGFCTDNYVPTYSTDHEMKAFNFYSIYRNYNYQTYINGNLVDLHD
jgi:hypothetical protein